MLDEYIDPDKNGTGKKGFRPFKGNEHGPNVNLLDSMGKAPGDTGYTGQPVQIIDDEGNPVEPATTIGITPPSAISDGNKTVTTAGTAVQLLTASTTCQYVVITALLANTGLISVGGSTTTPSGTVTGDILAAGDSTVVLIDNVNKVYINSTVNSEGVSFRYG